MHLQLVIRATVAKRDQNHAEPLEWLETVRNPGTVQPQPHAPSLPQDLNQAVIPKAPFSHNVTRPGRSRQG